MTDLYDVPPRIALDVSGLSGTEVTIIRTDDQGNKAPVRSANPAPLSGGEWVGYDYEAPFGVEVTYTATTDTDDGGTVGPLALVVTEPWLIHPGIPLLSQPVTILGGINERATSTSQGVFQVLGRANPIVITDGIRHGATFSLMLRTDTVKSSDALRTLLADTSPLLLQIAYPFTERRDYWFIAVGDVTEADMTGSYGMASRRWTLACTVVDAPAGTLQATWTWQDVVDQYETWQDVVDAFDTWRDVVTDSPHG